MKTMERVLERGSKYPRQERDRIKGMLQKGGLKQDKQELDLMLVYMVLTLLKIILLKTQEPYTFMICLSLLPEFHLRQFTTVIQL